MTRYELLDRIGVGGMAEIFRGRAVAGGGFEKPVAIKRILPRLSQDERFVKMLITEANTLSQLRHRNIAQIFDVGLGDDGQYFLVMEYVEGTDLGALFEALEKRGKRLPAHLSLHVAAEICDALDFAHRATSAKGTPLKLVHRDVSPSNVLLSTSGEVKLTDFGIAKRVEEATGHHGVRGKFAYISPEQAHNDSVDPRSDVYSLGIVLFELATGRRLFSALPDFEALHAVRSGAVPRPREYDPSMPVGLESMITRALERDPTRRFQNAAEFGSALRDYRYSSLTTAGDPAKELARILEIARRRAQEEQELTHEPTVLRIHTAAGFSGLGLERRLLSDAGFDEEETRAMSGEQINKIISEKVDSGAFRAPQLANEATQELSIEQLLEVAPIADAETKLIDTRARSSNAPVAPRAATPTVRETFRSGALLDRGDPSSREVQTEYVARYDEKAAKRRVVVASVLAVSLAIAAFVVAGSLLSSDDEISPGLVPAADVDAGAEEPSVDLPEDEIETLVVPPDAGAAAPKPRVEKKKRKKRPPRKKKRKKKKATRKTR
jgi:serine/threonine-protein kinase